MIIYIYIYWLVLWNINFIFPYIGNVIIPFDELIFFRGVGQPPISIYYSLDQVLITINHY